ncbi:MULTISPECIES: PilZ domain-containing protein [unclassified Beijerinckia]|uniref:PilZ domain-containing protein n=1 Tax=unclassified Beijerinckia TaxID=2638183 RepID=UPI000896A3F4|nr:MULTISPECIES: PilZ domain-containing protein [unclassified Beijerinckia]MDH7798253.1 hypothetical protein [Beijerinckia sp. GAS462]SED14531.1 PilZ domain-containing protein [Beijerinckia sp. 28-YEA-48]
MGVRHEWVGRRQAVRQACHMRAEMRFIDGRKSIDCMITDISATGARLELPEGFDCPQDFDLYIPSRDETKHAKVHRITDEGVGVTFLKSRTEEPLVVMIERLAQLELAFNEAKSLAPSRDGDVRRAVAQVEALPALEARINELAAGLADLRAMFETRIATPAPEPIDHAREIASLREEIRHVNEAAAQPAREFAEETARDFAGIRADMGRLDTSVRALTEMASVNAALTPNDHGPEIISLRGEVAALAAAVRDVMEGAAPPSTPAEDLSDIRAEMEKLGVSMRGQAHIPRPELFRSEESDPAATPLASASSAAEIVELKAQIAELRAAVAKLSAEPAVPVEGGSDALRGEVAELRQSVRALILVVAKSLNTPRQAA